MNKVTCNKGDYTKDRHKILGGLRVEQVVAAIRRRRSK